MNLFSLQNPDNREVRVNFEVIDRFAVAVNCKLCGVKIGLVQNFSSGKEIRVNENDVIMDIKEAREFWKHLVSCKYERVS